MAGSLPRLVADLQSTAAYDHAVDAVEVVQTHISYVLLAGEYAYKIKKPLNLGFLDYSTLERRRHMCEEEVRLNRRLCDGIYLGVVPIVRRADGRHEFGGAGEPAVEHAVRMRRVPDERTMPHLLEVGRLNRAHLASLATRIALFHRDARTGPRIAGFGRVPALRLNWQENFDQTRPYAGRTLTDLQLNVLRGYVGRFLREHAQLINQRADDGRVREGHGDLRADSVVFGPDDSVCVMDCIEFSERLRCGDVASDVAFLAMDLEFRGFRREADEFVSLYIEAWDHDETLPVMLNFYRAYRAYVRGKVDSMQTAEPEIPAAQRSAAELRAKRYFDQAEGHAVAPASHALIITVGLSGTGKSFMARALAGRVGAVLLSTDMIRRELVEEGVTYPAWYGEAAYTERERDRAYVRMIERAQHHLSLGRSVVLDGTFLARRHREAALRLAEGANVQAIVVETTADETVVRERLAARTGAGGVSDARWDTYVEQRKRLEPLSDDVAGASLVRLDSSAPLDRQVDDVLGVVRVDL